MTRSEREQLAVLETKVDAMQKQIEELHHAIIGNGKPGLMLRVDRLEQVGKLRYSLFWLFFSTTIGCVGTYIIFLVTK